MMHEELISGCLNNNPLAQRELFNRFSPKMLGICYRFAQSREDAEDILQESFIKVFSKLPTYQFKGSFEGWVRKIVVFTCINFLKRNKQFNGMEDLELAGNHPFHEESVASIIQGKQVLECIMDLPLGYRTVLNLYAIEGYSHKEVGELLEIAESSSRSQYARARAMLFQILVKKKIIESLPLHKVLLPVVVPPLK